MSRVKGGCTTRHRRKKIIKAAESYYGTKRKSPRSAKEQVMNSLVYAYRDRKTCKRDFRKFWITRINAAVRKENISYSQFMKGLKQLNNLMLLNRKMLAELAVNYEEVFKKIVLIVKNNLAKNAELAINYEENFKKNVLIAKSSN